LVENNIKTFIGKNLRHNLLLGIRFKYSYFVTGFGKSIPVSFGVLTTYRVGLPIAPATLASFALMAGWMRSTANHPRRTK
jgi:hypothetical protein